MQDTGGSREIRIVARESIYIYGANLILSILGFIYWAIAAKTVPSSVVGSSSTIVSLATITITIASLGMNISILRVSGTRPGEAPRIFMTALIMGVASLALASTLGLPIYTRLLESPSASALVVALVLAWGPLIVMETSLIAVRRAKYLLYTRLISGGARLLAGIPLVMLTPTILGVVGGYLTGFAAALALATTLVVLNGLTRGRPSRFYARELIRAGTPVWLPSVVMVVGSQLAVVYTYALRGGEEAGYLYIAQTIALAIDMARSAIAWAIIPSIASNSINYSDLGNLIRRVYSVLLPVNMTLFIFPEPLLLAINPEYLSSITPLRIYVISNIILLLIGLLATNIYARGNYRYTLIMDTSMSLTRVILYPVLTSLYGAVGAAMAFLAGTLVLAVFVTLASGSVGLPYKKIVGALLLSVLLGVVLKSIAATSGIVVDAGLAILYLAILYLAQVMIKLTSKSELIELVKTMITAVKALR